MSFRVACARSTEIFRWKLKMGRQYETPYPKVKRMRKLLMVLWILTIASLSGKVSKVGD